MLQHSAKYISLMLVSLWLAVIWHGRSSSGPGCLHRWVTVHPVLHASLCPAMVEECDFGDVQESASMMPLWESTMTVTTDQVLGGFGMHHRTHTHTNTHTQTRAHTTHTHTQLHRVRVNLTGFSASPTTRDFFLAKFYIPGLFHLHLFAKTSPGLFLC